jgi:ABC-type nitrate/sulfonate/bicarbonate transport system permease component
MTLATIRHMMVGLAIAACLGIGLGALIGTSAKARAYLTPTLEFLRPFPSSAIIPVTIAFFGLTESMMLAVIAFGALWPILMATIHGFVTVEPRLRDVSQALGLSRPLPCRIFSPASVSRWRWHRSWRRWARC